MKFAGKEFKGMTDEELDRKTREAVDKAGGSWHLQAMLLRDLADVISTEENEKLESLKRPPVIEDSEAWGEAICLCLAFLRRCRMKETIATMQLEVGNLPRDVGYSKGSEIDGVFKELLRNKKKIPIEDRVHEFAKGLKVEKRRKKVK